MPSLLKSLELTGYKTFASKQKFEFSDSITAIVGPNGSGKSNIADAIRWVLGEQSFKLLRGRKTDDMIFSGSDKRARSGMASATITFDNSDGWLPIDFSEVSITRKAYRDGQNEYQINGSRVRLRDVSELLAKSGLSERTYTVIGQGLVDAALSLKADERRKLFEEAAGIGLYRSRKDQALKRLDNTKRNLERVRDILAELRPRLRSLERQAKRAEDYQHIQKDLKSAMREWYGYHWHKSQKDLNFSKAFAEKQENDLVSIREQHQAVSSKLNELRLKIQSHRSDLSTWQQEITNKHRHRENFSRDIAVAEERIRSLNTQLERDKQEITRLEDEQKYRKEQVDQANQELESIRNDFQDADARLQESRNTLNASETQKKQIYSKIDGINAEIQNLENQTTLSEARIEEYTNRIAESDQEIIETNEQKETVLIELNTLQTEIQELERKIIQASDEESALRSSIEENQAKVGEIRQKREAGKELISKALSDNAQMKAELDVLVEAEKNLTGYASGTKVLLEPANKSKFSSLGSLNTLISVEPEHEKAITSLLNLFMDAVVMEDMDASLKALDFLENQTLKTALLPVQNIGIENTISTPSHPGVIGFAVDLIEADGKIKPLLKKVLHNCLVVENRKIASELLQSLSGDFQIVTLKGEVFYSSGAILVNNEDTPSTFTRSRKMEDLEKSIEKNISEISRLQTEIDKQAESLQELGSSLEENEKAYLESSKRISSLQNEINLKQQSRIRVEQKSEWQTEQVNRLGTEIRKTKDTIESERAKIRENGNSIEGLKDSQRTLREEVAGIDVSDLESQLNHWSMIHALGEEKLRNSQSISSERNSAYQNVLKQINTINQRISSSGNTIQQIKQNISSTSETEGSLQAEIEEINKKLQPAREELEKFETAYNEAQSEEESTRNNLNIAERHTNQAQMSYMRQQEAFSNLQDRIQDDFGLVSFQYATDISGPTPLPFEGYVEELPVITELSDDVEKNMKGLRNQLRRLGSINPEAHQEYQDVKERHEFLTNQSADLEKAEADVREVITELDDLMRVEFRKTFDVVAEEFKTIFTRLFGGGHAQLILTNEEEISEAGIEIEAKLPGKRMQRLSMLSGGERSLTAAALVFSLIKASPTPFCVMDEVDAMLDESNVGRFCDMLAELSSETQFVLITHNRNTVQTAEVIYGITMGKDTASQMISLKLEDVDDRYSAK